MIPENIIKLVVEYQSGYSNGWTREWARAKLLEALKEAGEIQAYIIEAL